MGAARPPEWPCESVERHYLHDAEETLCYLQPAGLWLSDFDKVSHRGPQSSYRRGPAPAPLSPLAHWRCAYTHKQKILRKHKILLSQHTLDGKCVCWQGKEAGESVWLAGLCLKGCSTSANSPTESSSVSPSTKRLRLTVQRVPPGIDRGVFTAAAKVFHLI